MYLVHLSYPSRPPTWFYDFSDLMQFGLSNFIASNKEVASYSTLGRNIKNLLSKGYDGYEKTSLKHGKSFSIPWPKQVHQKKKTRDRGS